MKSPISIKEKFAIILKSTVNSYSQIFFSNNVLFAFILIAVTFFDIYAGISGILAVMISNLVAFFFGLNRQNIKSGFYGFNSLLVGLGIGVFYQPSPEYFLVLLFISILTLFFTVALEGVIGKYGLPFLSLPFLLGIWAITIACREFSALQVSERGVYMLNDMYSLGGGEMVRLFDWFNNINLHESIIIYFKSLGAIFFQYHLFAGILVAVGLLIYSRISFTLSLIGYFSAYFYYQFIGASFTELSYGYIGFNYILTAIAIGGFFIVASKYSYFWVIVLTPLISIIISSTSVVLSLFQLSIYSLPFNVIVILFLYVLKFREKNIHRPEVVYHQQFSPEKNLYSHLNNKFRFDSSKYFPISLPFWGSWEIMQGHNGEFTHKKEWKHAWDFVIKDETDKTFSGSGNQCKDFYCFNKPVIAPADGLIEEIVSDVDDNEIGKVNLDQNWGNTIVIKHTTGLYSKLSHLKKESIQIKKGDAVKKGDLLAYCGNSGRSPEPHLHFQVQANPFIGSETLEYPLANYILNNEENYSFKNCDIPKEGDLISNIERNETIYNAFNFIPGQKLDFNVKRRNKDYDLNWNVIADVYNNTYIYCNKTKSKAWFKKDKDLIYFTHFDGDKKSVLYFFYLGSFKVLFGFYKNITIKDSYALTTLTNKILKVLQDFIAPFYMFMSAEFSLKYIDIDEYFDDSKALLQSVSEVKIGQRTIKKYNFDFEIDSKGILSFLITFNNTSIEVKKVVNE